MTDKKTDGLANIASSKEVVEFSGTKEFVLKADVVFKGDFSKTNEKITCTQNEYERLKKAGVL